MVCLLYTVEGAYTQEMNNENCLVFSHSFPFWGSTFLKRCSYLRGDL